MRERGSVKCCRNSGRIRRNVPPSCHSYRSVSGAEESTTLEEEPTQSKICYLGRFLGSLLFARNNKSGNVSTSAPVVPTMRNAVPPLIHRLRAVPLPRWGRFSWSFSGTFPTHFNGWEQTKSVCGHNNGEGPRPKTISLPIYLRSFFAFSFVLPLYEKEKLL